MPCWYYDKKDLVNTPSFRDGISSATEALYRKDGARFILDAGGKMGLRYETCSTGVVYFHRFYMFHSFAKFPRSITAAGCLFLAGKVEETPKKCRDLIRIIKTMLPEHQYAAFKDDPKEEIMVMEKILLQTIKFDLNVEHPHAYLLKFAKLINGDKEKVQKLVQMSWTFVNDSLCTSLCLQWEPDVIAVALIYLASRLSKFDISDWQGKYPGCRTRWYESFVEGVTLELLEDICHQVLDLYSKPYSKNSSPHTTNASKKEQNNQSAVQQVTPVENKSQKASAPSQFQNIPSIYQNNSIIVANHNHPPNSLPVTTNPPLVQASVPVQPMVKDWPAQQYHTNNPYVATTMFGSSFLSKEGTRSIQSLVCKQYPPAPLNTTYQSQIAPPPPPPPSATQNYKPYTHSEQAVFKKAPLLAHPPQYNTSHRSQSWR